LRELVEFMTQDSNKDLKQGIQKLNEKSRMINRGNFRYKYKYAYEQE